jgi:hypothetical protein
MDRDDNGEHEDSSILLRCFLDPSGLLFLVIFRLQPYRFHFRAKESIYFPPAKAGNVLRGALGSTLSELTPRRPESPGGFANPPQPFVFRAAHLDGRRLQAGEHFSFGLNIFDLHTPLLDTFTGIFAGWAITGLGPRRGCVELLDAQLLHAVSLDLSPGPPASRCSLAFRTPTDLKGTSQQEDVPFNLLFARVRDRISALQTCFAPSPLSADFSGIGARASHVNTLRSDLQYNAVSRRSSRTGQTHDIGGLTGSVDYEGELTEFLPWLHAARWTGIGRHTVWGNGEIEVTHFE